MCRERQSKIFYGLNLLSSKIYSSAFCVINFIYLMFCDALEMRAVYMVCMHASNSWTCQFSKLIYRFFHYATFNFTQTLTCNWLLYRWYWTISLSRGIKKYSKKNIDILSNLDSKIAQNLTSDNYYSCNDGIVRNVHPLKCSWL